MPLDANTVKKVGAAGIIAIALLIKPFEGEKLKAYLDTPGKATICYGHTKGVKISDIATPRQCDVYLGDDVSETESGLDRLIKIKISDKTRAVFIDFAYNEGIGNFTRSDALSDLNRGDISASCGDLARCEMNKKTGRMTGWGCGWSGDERLNGLTRRREAEKKLCLEGLKP